MKGRSVNKIVEAVLESVYPSEKETEKLKRDLAEITAKIESALKKNKVDARIMVGGSVAKGTWLPGIHDIDLFLRFKYQKYRDRSGELSEIAGFVLNSCFQNLRRLHGSRDYFQARIKGYEIEIIPVLEISSPKSALNITDTSPLHVLWMKKKLAKKPGLNNEARLAKQFFKGQGVYGAESYIRGFSGHVIEILTVHYGSFNKLVKAIAGWKRGTVIDHEKHYKSSKEVLSTLNDEKLQSPVVIVDPLEKDRNAAAALSEEKFDKIVAGCQKFLKRPNESFFRETRLTVEDIKKKQKKRRLIIYEAEPKNAKADVAGAKILKQFEYIHRIFRENDFDVLESGWQWDKKHPALLWLILPARDLPKTKIHTGPLTYGEQSHILAFKNKYKQRKIWREGYHYYVELPRRYTKVSQIVNALKKDKFLKNFKLVCCK